MDVAVNAAMSADGKISTVDRGRTTISGPADLSRMQQMRARVDAIMVGIGTVLADDPHLTIQSADSDQPSNAPPVRVVADSRARTPLDARILDAVAPTIILVSKSAKSNKIDRLERAGATVIQCGDDRVDLPAGISKLADHGVDRLMVEGGGELIFSCFSAGIVDRLSVYIGNQIIGGRSAPTLADGTGFTRSHEFPMLSLDSIEQIDAGVVLHWEVKPDAANSI